MYIRYILPKNIIVKDNSHNLKIIKYMNDSDVFNNNTCFLTVRMFLDRILTTTAGKGKKKLHKKIEH